MSDPQPPQNGVTLQVHGLRKSFDGREVLKGLDFEVQRGEVFVVMGPSGSGKSVLLKHLIGLEKPDAGEILIEEQSIQTPGVTAPLTAPNDNANLNVTFTYTGAP